MTFENYYLTNEHIFKKGNIESIDNVALSGLVKQMSLTAVTLIPPSNTVWPSIRGNIFI